jgi:hypothetical protein
LWLTKVFDFLGRIITRKGKTLCVAYFGVRCGVLGTKWKKKNTEQVYYKVRAVVAIVMGGGRISQKSLCPIYARNFQQFQLPER